MYTYTWVWANQIGLKLTLEKVQNKFVLLILFKCSILINPHSSYLLLLSFLNMATFERRTLCLSFLILLKIMNNKIHYSNFLSRFTFNTSVIRTCFNNNSYFKLLFLNILIIYFIYPHSTQIS